METLQASQPVVAVAKQRTTQPTNLVASAVKQFHSALKKVSDLSGAFRKAGTEVLTAFLAQETKDIKALADAYVVSVNDIGMLTLMGIAARDGVKCEDGGDFFALGQAALKFDFSDTEAFASLLSSVGKSKDITDMVRFVRNHANAQAKAKSDSRKTGPKTGQQKGESGANQFIENAGEVSTEVLKKVITAAQAALKDRK
jgi:hypothetical protein